MKLLIAYLSVALIFSCQSNKESNQINSGIKQLKSDNRNLSQRITQMKARNRSLQKQFRFAETKSLIGDYGIKKLKVKGLNNPIQDLQSDLIKHPELIPHKGILGGTVGFGQDQDSIKILNEKWVLATFSDGHFGGELFLEFDIVKGKIKWKVIETTLK